MTLPDFTKGDVIPEGANHDWNLGATGLRGWIYTNQMSTADARQIYVTKVDKGSPADGILAVGDVILGVGGKAFSYDPRTEFGKALTAAESEAGGGKLSLIRWRDGKTEIVVVKLPVLGTYSATAPYDCPKSRAHPRAGLQGAGQANRRALLPSERDHPKPQRPGAAGQRQSRVPAVGEEGSPMGGGYSASATVQTWWYGYVISLLAEYKMATGDESVMPGLRRLALEAASGQSIVGSWGHGFAEPDGRCGGYGMMNAPGLPLTISLILAREAGVNDAMVTQAIDRSVRLLHFYAGKGSIPYGDHVPWIQTHEDNGKNGMAAVMFNLLGDAQAAEYFSRMAIASHGNERDYGHAGNIWNILWSMPGVVQSGPNAAGAWMSEFGAWYFDLAREWDGTFGYQGPPEWKHNGYKGWDCSGGYLLAYAMPLKKIYLTGKGESHAPQVSMAEAKSIVDDGRGWTRRDRNSFYDALTTDQLIARLGNWSPVVRQRAAEALGRRKDDVIDRLIDMLDAKDAYTRYGACRAIKMQRDRGAPAVAALLKTFRSDDLWLRILSAEALAGIGEPARSAAPEMLERLTKSDPKNDPRNMEQRYLSFALFNNGQWPAEQVARGRGPRPAPQGRPGRPEERRRQGAGQLRHRVRQPDASTRSSRCCRPFSRRSSSVLPAASCSPTTSARRGLRYWRRHHIAEAMPLCIDIMDIQRWGKNWRIHGCLKALEYYRRRRQTAAAPAGRTRKATGEPQGSQDASVAHRIASQDHRGDQGGRESAQTAQHRPAPQRNENRRSR